MLRKMFVALTLVGLLVVTPAVADEPDLVVAPLVETTEERLDRSEQEHSHFLNREDAGTLSNMAYITPKRVVFKLYSSMSVSDFIRMSDDLTKIRDYTDKRKVELTLNSGGGSAFTGLSMADLIERYQNDHGFEFTVRATGIVASAAVPVFAVCKHREPSPGTIFMVHEAALWKWPGKETASDIRAQARMIKLLQDRYLDYLVRNSTTSLKEWERMEKATTWFTVTEARELGLIERGGK